MLFYIFILSLVQYYVLREYKSCVEMPDLGDLVYQPKTIPISPQNVYANSMILYQSHTIFFLRCERSEYCPGLWFFILQETHMHKN